MRMHTAATYTYTLEGAAVCACACPWFSKRVDLQYTEPPSQYVVYYTIVCSAADIMISTEKLKILSEIDHFDDTKYP